ncbi:MAG: isocitrate lyase/PEP mutase family protein [Rhodospirillales bacterium]|nr:isocitrate lyase/PEP mutase family protein [Rhodospirillales bacterium]
MQQRKWLRERLAAGRTVWGAGCYDALSAKLIEAAGFEAVLTSGFGVSASFLGKPDVELYTMTENLAVVRQVVNTVEIPVVADCDTGYGNAVNVMRTVREFEQAGVAAVILEDQVVPKRCPAVANRIEVIPIGEGVAKIRAAVEARRDPELVIIARTDAGSEEEAVARAQAYAAAGADMVQPISKTMKDADMLRRFGKAAGRPVSLQVLGWLEKALSPADLEEIAGIAFFPLVALMTAANAIETNLKALRAARSTAALPLACMDHKAFAERLDFSKIEDIQMRLLPEAPVFAHQAAD